MKRTARTRARAIGILAIASMAMLVFAVATLEGRATALAGSMTPAAVMSKCSIVITGAPWRIRTGATLSGDRYTLAAENVSCSSERRWVIAATHQHGKTFGQSFSGPLGFKCQSFSTAGSGDKLLYQGTCTHGPHNVPFFGWAPKVPGH